MSAWVEARRKRRKLFVRRRTQAVYKLSRITVLHVAVLASGRAEIQGRKGVRAERWMDLVGRRSVGPWKDEESVLDTLYDDATTSVALPRQICPLKTERCLAETCSKLGRSQRHTRLVSNRNRSLDCTALTYFFSSSASLSVLPGLACCPTSSASFAFCPSRPRFDTIPSRLIDFQDC